MDFSLENNGHQRPAQTSNSEPTLDFSKLIRISKKSILPVILILTLTNLTAYLIIRYTRPLFESRSELKLDVESKAGILGISTPNDLKINNLSGEIELIRSRLFIDQVISNVDLDVSYYAYGKILFDERYKNSPFEIRYELKNHSFYDRKFEVTIENRQNFLLTYYLGDQVVEKRYRFGEEIDTPYFNFIFFLTNHYQEDLEEKKYFFTINSHNAQASYLTRNLGVSPINFNANTILITFKDHNRYKAQDLVNAIDTMYLNYTLQEKRQANNQKINFIDQQLQQSEKKLMAFESYFEDFTIDHKTVNLHTDLNKTIDLMIQLDSQEISYENRLEHINELSNELDRAVEISPLKYAKLPSLFQQKIKEIADLAKRYQMILYSYNENTFAVQKIQQELELVKNDLAEFLEDERINLQEHLARIKNRKAELEKTFAQLPSMETEYNKAKRYYSLYENFYLTLMQRKTEFEIAQAGVITDFKILSPASLPGTPIAPKKGFIISIGLTSGLILSLLLIVLRYVFDNKIGSKSELERLTSLPLMGMVPTQKMSDELRLVVDEVPNSMISESFRSIRTNLDFFGLNKSKKVLSISSTVSGEGKTFIAVNLGAILAKTSQKVIILDFDLRKPNVAIYLEGEKKTYEKGLSTILINKYQWQECVLPTSVANMEYIPAGPLPPNPSELILTEAFSQLLESLKEAYDVILIDNPPIGVVTDGFLTMRNADLSIFILRSDYSRKDFVLNINKLVKDKRLNNVSLILNGINFADTGYTRNGYINGYYYNNKKRQRKSLLAKFLNF